MIYQHYAHDLRGAIVGICTNEPESSMADCPYSFVTVEADTETPVYSHHKHYILNGEPTERPSSPITRTGLVLSNVPTGSTLFINGDSYAAKGTVDLEFPLPGVYSLRVECFPYLDWSDEVTV